MLPSDPQAIRGDIDGIHREPLLPESIAEESASATDVQDSMRALSPQNLGNPRRPQTCLGPQKRNRVVLSGMPSLAQFVVDLVVHRDLSVSHRPPRSNTGSGKA